ncbi:ecotin family protein [Burkholderia sp. Ac-20379]|uniref:ecotin family protein n=1 Tax=Burkholderia sp. Ac-20379 TaxID=2703900 RepID=UPI00197EC2C0|nr:ecotin family protein [Burkholderia sp. Ac-20379]MBN3728007.1 ecotin [Burkholderia sp. Ac-20379]
MHRPNRLSVAAALVVALCASGAAFAQTGTPAPAPAAVPANPVAPVPPTAANLDLTSYPAPQPGMQRSVIALPALPLEEDVRVQVIVGKTLPIDCNVRSFPARLQHDTVPGTGYPLYRVTDVGPVASTMMACPPSAAPQTGFVIGRGDGFLLRYNSRLPVVVYAPVGYDVRYRLWQGSNEVGRATVR